METNYTERSVKRTYNEHLSVNNVLGMIIYIVILGILIWYIISTFRGDKGE